jgi:hypothetical protein
VLSDVIQSPLFQFTDISILRGKIGELLDKLSAIYNSKPSSIPHSDSGFAHVDCLANKEAFTVGKSLIKILATAVIPEILQSNNGGEFTARCIELIERHYPTIHIVKGHPRHPQSQGCIEQGNGPFKEALDVWISQNPGVSWAEVGAYVVYVR